MTETILTLEKKVPTVKCTNEDCKMEFILMAVMREHAETYSCVEAYNTTIWEQVDASYCPYCGTKRDVQGNLRERKEAGKHG